MSQNTVLFLSLVFLAAFLLTISLSTSVFGENRQARKRLRSRIGDLTDDGNTAAVGAIKLRRDSLGSLSPLERSLESLPILDDLQLFIKQSGNKVLAYRFVAISIAAGLFGAIFAWIAAHSALVMFLGLVGGASIPYFKIRHDRNKRLDLFEEQLPDAIDVMKRALQAGYPFNEALHLVQDELADPIAEEFGETFAELTYGSDPKHALLNLLNRVPSVNVMALVTSILVQRESGGNLVEILSKLSKLIRERFKFHRKIKTLSAEGRMSAWVLSMVPFVLFAILWFTAHGYLDPLFEEPDGHKLLAGGGIGMVVGIFWISRLIRIEV